MRAFQELLAGYPAPVQGVLADVPRQGGRIGVSQCDRLIGALNIAPETLMTYLLPLAAAFSISPVSGFKVGAVAMSRRGSDGIQLFFGANMEFMPLTLHHTIHAETAAVVNAWHNGGAAVAAIAVNEPPCGYCRQFLNELSTSDVLDIHVSGKGPMVKMTLVRLLPEAFGPKDLGVGRRLMQPAGADPELTLKFPSDDPVVAAACDAAKKTYAPYTGNLAGCAVKSRSGVIHQGRYLETAAYNPSLTPLQSALILRHLGQTSARDDIVRAVLVEKPTHIRQKESVALLLNAWAPRVKLEYYQAVDTGGDAKI